MIAAHALALGLTLVTSDRAFPRIARLDVEDWTKPWRRAP
jgi:predicted nucleic acid-binding protein